MSIEGDPRLHLFCFPLLCDWSRNSRHSQSIRCKTETTRVFPRFWGQSLFIGWGRWFWEWVVANRVWSEKIDRQLTAHAGNLKNVKERWGGGGNWKSGNFYRDTNISIFNLFLGLVEKIGLNSPISFWLGLNLSSSIQLTLSPSLSTWLQRTGTIYQ